MCFHSSDQVLRRVFKECLCHGNAVIMGPERDLGQSMISCVVGTCVAETNGLLEFIF